MGPDPAAVAVDHVDQLAGQFLAAAPHVEGAFLQVVVDQTPAWRVTGVREGGVA